MTPSQFEQFTELRRLLKEAYVHRLARDAHCKSSEGLVQLHYPDLGQGARFDEPIAISIYSYVFGSHRMHTWVRPHCRVAVHGVRYVAEDPLTAALDVVRRWHARELSDADDVSAIPGVDEFPVLEPWTAHELEAFHRKVYTNSHFGAHGNADPTHYPKPYPEG